MSPQDKYYYALEVLGGKKEIKIGDLTYVIHTLKEIRDFGWKEYSSLLSYSTITKNDYLNSKRIRELEKTYTKELVDELRGMSLEELTFVMPDLKGSLIYFLQFFVSCDVIMPSTRNESIILQDKDEVIEVNKDNINEIFSNVQFLYCYEPQKGESDEEILKRCRGDLETMEMYKASIARKNELAMRSGMNVTKKSMISYVVAMDGSLNYLNIWDLNEMQLQDEYKRLKRINDFDHKISGLYTGMMTEEGSKKLVKELKSILPDIEKI